MIEINSFAARIHKQNKKIGWWEGEQCLYEKLQLVSTEVSESTEGERKDLMDDHLPHRKMAEVELADTLIRVLDLGTYLDLEYYKPYDPSIQADCYYSDSVGGIHLTINKHIINFAEHLKYGNIISLSVCYSKLITLILDVARRFNYDVMGAALEKVQYNLTRADHQPKNRVKDGGKKF